MNDKIETECPECGSTVRFTLGDAARQREARCSRGHRVKIQDEGDNAREALRAQGGLEKALNEFGK